MIKIQTSHPNIEVEYGADCKLKSISLKEGCDKIEWEATRKEIEFYFIENSKLGFNNEEQQQVNTDFP